ncbi:hypothetical protein NDU88_002890 [Pleurodeles waltl]|uniref:Uncharacterized protein n=1 Tax=Pleurodeles waltl TaxID=8319 RepID=A0AAV7SE08_PLEWA|nr:hypothetical protein NDU88_002890 [Pleurodeles waltl]
MTPEVEGTRDEDVFLEAYILQRSSEEQDAVRRIAAQKEGEDTQRPATFREERGHLWYEPLHKRRTRQSGGGTKEREAGGGKGKKTRARGTVDQQAPLGKQLLMEWKGTGTCTIER